VSYQNKAIESLENAAEKYIEKGNYYYAAECFTQIADIYKETKQPKKAVSYQNKAIESLENAAEKYIEEGYYYYAAKCFTQIADIYKETKQPKILITDISRRAYMIRTAGEILNRV
jgi:tetratricopeptide (TPR) repeat protein